MYGHFVDIPREPKRYVPSPLDVADLRHSTALVVPSPLHAHALARPRKLPCRTRTLVIKGIASAIEHCTVTTCSDVMVGSVSSSNTSAAPSGDSASDAQICRCDKKHPTAPSESSLCSARHPRHIGARVRPHHAVYIISAHTTRVDCRPPLHVEAKAAQLRDRHRHAVCSLV